MERKSVSGTQRPALLIVTSKVCGACKSFKANVLDNLLKKLEKLNCSVKHVDLEDFSAGNLVNLAPEIPSSAQTYISWFPTMLLFAPGYQGVPKVFNGKIKGSTADYSQEKPFTAEAISTWVEENLSTVSPVKKGENLPSAKVRYVLVKDGKPLSHRPSRFIRRDY